MKLHAVSAEQVAPNRIITIANICSGHSVQAQKEENVTVNYCGEARACTVCIFDSLLPIPLLPSSPKIMPLGLADLLLHN